MSLGVLIRSLWLHLREWIRRREEKICKVAILIILLSCDAGLEEDSDSKDGFYYWCS